MTGQAARAVIGQTSFTSQVSGASNTILGAVGGLAYCADTLLVADSTRLGFTPNNNRVLIFSGVQELFPPATAEIPPQTVTCAFCGGQALGVIGEPDFITTTATTTANGMNLPTAVACDGQHIAVADTNNNRVLIWNTIPGSTNLGAPADVVVGQPNFTTVGPVVVSASTFRAPEGVWLQNGKLFVADTQNNRVLIWNSIPTSNGQPADVVIGQSNFTTVPPIYQTSSSLTATAGTMLSPVSVTSDGTHLFVSDLGYNRVLIWNSIPTHNGQPADLEIGQQNFTNTIANDSAGLCPPSGQTDSSGNPIYPSTCGRALNFPRFALSDGQRLFVADGGNDRVLVFSHVPTQNAPEADFVLGQPNEFDVNVVSSSYDPNNPVGTNSASNSTPTPTSLAWDGQNLYVADATNFRVLIFSPEDSNVPLNGVVNAASREVFSQATIPVTGTITANDTATVTLNGTAYGPYKILKTDTLQTVADNLAALINDSNSDAGDPNVVVYSIPNAATLLLVARQPGANGNNITVATSVSTNATIVLTASGGTLSGGGNAAILAPGSLFTIRGQNLSEDIGSADLTQVQLPWELANVEVYFDGNRAPLLYVSPTQINAQVPFEITGVTSTSCYIRIQHKDGTVTVSDPVGITIAEQNPGIFAVDNAQGTEPRVAVAQHASSYATGTVSVAGSIQAGDAGTVKIQDRQYTYTVGSTDSLASVRDALIALINANPEEVVVASAALLNTNIRLQAKVPGPQGDGIAISTNVTTVGTNNSGATLALSTTGSALCCANIAGAPVTQDNPAQPGETIILYATGLGLITPNVAKNDLQTGAQYAGPANNSPVANVDSLLGGATVVSASLVVGQVGIYKIVLELSSSISPSVQAQLSILQTSYYSNIVTLPVAAQPGQNALPALRKASETATSSQTTPASQAAVRARPRTNPRLSQAQSVP